MFNPGDKVFTSSDFNRAFDKEGREIYPKEIEKVVLAKGRQPEYEVEGARYCEEVILAPVEFWIEVRATCLERLKKAEEMISSLIDKKNNQ